MATEQNNAAARAAEYHRRPSELRRLVQAALDAAAENYPALRALGETFRALPSAHDGVCASWEAHEQAMSVVPPAYHYSGAADDTQAMVAWDAASLAAAAAAGMMTWDGRGGDHSRRFDVAEIHAHRSLCQSGSPLGNLEIARGGPGGRWQTDAELRAVDAARRITWLAPV